LPLFFLPSFILLLHLHSNGDMANSLSLSLSVLITIPLRIGLSIPLCTDYLLAPAETCEPFYHSSLETKAGLLLPLLHWQSLIHIRISLMSLLVSLSLPLNTLLVTIIEAKIGKDGFTPKTFAWMMAAEWTLTLDSDVLVQSLYTAALLHPPLLNGNVLVNLIIITNPLV